MFRSLSPQRIEGMMYAPRDDGRVVGWGTTLPRECGAKLREKENVIIIGRRFTESSKEIDLSGTLIVPFESAKANLHWCSSYFSSNFKLFESILRQSPPA